MEGSLKIGQMATRTGLTRKAIRFYEAAGVLPPAARGSNSYRLYTDDAVDMLRFVKQATGLGLTLAEIREIVAIRHGGRPPCPHVHRLLQEKARELDQKLRDLLAMQREVRRSLAAWRRAPKGKTTVCPHIEGHQGARRARRPSNAKNV